MSKNFTFSSITKLLLMSAGVLFVATSSLAQGSQSKKTRTIWPSKIRTFNPSASPVLNVPGCDTFNIIPDDANLVTYETNVGGFVTGTNGYGDLQKANYFDASSTGEIYLTKVLILFSVANGSNLSKVIPIRVFDGTSGVPGTSLGVTNTTLQVIHDSVAAESINEFTFTPAINLPASKKFFISVDISNLDWASDDSLAVLGTEFAGDPGAVSVHNAAWEQWSDNTWHAFSDEDNWDDSLIHVIVPIIGTSLTCGSITAPVKLTTFSGERFGMANKLKWSTATETSNLGFEAERSSDGLQFSKIGFTASKASQGNSSHKLDYQFIDEHPFAKTNFYRLKQLDHNGKVTYSSVVMVNGAGRVPSGIVSIYPNPVKNRLNLTLVSSSPGTANIIISDVSGKVMLQKVVQATEGNQNFSVNVSGYASGIYLVKMSTDKDNVISTMKFVKE